MDDLTEISQLVLRERDSRTKRLSDIAATCFHPDATVRISWYTGPADGFVAAGGTPADTGAPPVVGRLSPPIVNRRDRRAVVELPTTTVHWIQVNGVEAELQTFMRLIYRTERRSGEWRISDLTAIYESDSLRPAVPGADLRIDAAAVTHLRHSYRWLAYTRSLDGHSVSPDLVGIDRAETVDALYEQSALWLSSPPRDEMDAA